jgi:hypothetical protein
MWTSFILGVCESGVLYTYILKNGWWTNQRGPSPKEKKKLEGGPPLLTN